MLFERKNGRNAKIYYKKKANDNLWVSISSEKTVEQSAKHQENEFNMMEDRTPISFRNLCKSCGRHTTSKKTGTSVLVLHLLQVKPQTLQTMW